MASTVTNSCRVWNAQVREPAPMGNPNPNPKPNPNPNPSPNPNPNPNPNPSPNPNPNQVREPAAMGALGDLEHLRPLLGTGARLARVGVRVS